MKAKPWTLYPEPYTSQPFTQTLQEGQYIFMVLEYAPGGPVYDPEKFQHKVRQCRV
jgi:hypothetical protein